MKREKVESEDQGKKRVSRVFGRRGGPPSSFSIRLRMYYRGKKHLIPLCIPKQPRQGRGWYREPAQKPRPHQHLRRRKITTGIENNDGRERYVRRCGSMWEDRRKDYKREEEARATSWQTEKYMEITTSARKHKLTEKRNFANVGEKIRLVKKIFRATRRAAYANDKNLFLQVLVSSTILQIVYLLLQ